MQPAIYPKTSMPHLISELVLPTDLLNIYGEGEPGRLRRLKQINVFIGPNNSGKSRLLRWLFSSSELVFSAYDPSTCDFIYELQDLHKANPTEYKAFEQLLSAVNLPFENLAGAFRKIGNQISHQDVQRLCELTLPHSRTSPSTYQKLRNFQHEYQIIKRAEQGSNHNPTARGFKFIYIPTLRGLRPLRPKDDKVTGSPLKARTMRDYFEGKQNLRNNIEAEIFTGESIYELLRTHLLGTHAERSLIRNFETYLSKSFFESREVTLTPKHDSDVVYIKIGNEEDLPIYELGDGIQQLIILTLPMYLYASEKLLLFIEEPELYLHAGMQRAFIERALQDDATRQLFITTHSSQFLDTTLDSTKCAIYRTAKTVADDNRTPRARTDICRIDFGDFSVLRELGIRNSSVLLANCTIWVEGITDRLYIRKFLELYLKTQPKQLLEDMHYAFVEYGGANLTHWSVLGDTGSEMHAHFTCGPMFLIADTDKGKESKHEILRHKLGQDYHQLTVREIENLLTPTVISTIISSYEGPNSTLKSFDQSDYEQAPLGTFIETQVVQNRKRRAPYSSESGTINDKLNFCNKALVLMREFNDLSDPAQDLAKKVCAFVRSHNHGEVGA